MQDDLRVIAPEGNAGQGITSGPAAAVKLPGHVTEQTVLAVHHWTDRLFSLTLTRDPSFRFENGQFVMIGLMVDGKPLLRAYSMASPNHHDTLEFLSIKVPDGPLTSRLQDVKLGRQGARRAQADGDAAAWQSASGTHAVHDLHRHRHGAVPEPGGRSRRV